MVLKKSNTPFNSGASQKCLNRGAYRSLRISPEQVLTITVTGLPRWYDEKIPLREHTRTLEKIYDHLGIRGPSLKIFYDFYSEHLFHDRTTKSLDISLNKRHLWHIPERINTLMKENYNNFLDAEKEDEFLEIRVEKVKGIVDKNTIYNKKSCVLNPKSKKDLNNFVKKTKRAETLGRGRGLQRPFLITSASRDDDARNGNRHEQRPKNMVEIELHEKDHIDAGILGRHYSKGYRRWKKLESTKGCVNGKKVYHLRMLRKEINGIITSFKVLEEDDRLFCDNNDDDDDDDDEKVDDCDDYYYDRCRAPRICDYFPVSPESHRREKTLKRSKNREKEDIMDVDNVQLVNVNTASSLTTLRHPKGSYQLIRRPRDIAEDNESTSSSCDDFVYITYDDINQLQDSERVRTQEIDIKKTEIPILFDTFGNKDNFVAVNLQLTSHIQEAIESSLFQSRCYNFSSNDSIIVLGNCYPPFFSINLEQSETGWDHGYSLVGTSCSEMSSYEDLEWEITLKNTKSFSEHVNVKDNFFCNLDLKTNCVLQLHELKQMALESIQNAFSNNLANSNNDDIMSKPTFVTNRLVDDSSVFATIKDVRPIVCSIGTAVKNLETDQIINSQPFASPSVTTTNTKIKIPITNYVECVICFQLCDKHGRKDSGMITLLPCQHSFCYKCWRSYMFHHTTTSSTEIRCMHADCEIALNETMMNALIPEKQLAKLYWQRQERRIDASPLCQRCPKPNCNKISTITKMSRHIQYFGCCVVCDCKTLYCFSCQEMPHWPMSCTQAAAYRKLLFKIGTEIMSEEVTCDIYLKPCPGCKYPFDKNDGCSTVRCTVCGIYFCWKCLKRAGGHRLWSCSESENKKIVMYQLHNEIIYNIPLKFFTKSLVMRNKSRHIMQTSIQSWLNGLDNVRCKKIKLSFDRSVRLEEATVVDKAGVVRLATETVAFLKDSYSFLEYFCIVFSFSLLNKGKENDKTRQQLSTQRVMDRLVFTSWRLEDRVLGKSFKQLFLSVNTSQIYLANGRERLQELKDRVASIQKRSKNVPTRPFGELDPQKYYRYK